MYIAIEINFRKEVTIRINPGYLTGALCKNDKIESIDQVTARQSLRADFGLKLVYK